MIVQRGNPPETGRYVCYLMGDDGLATVVRLWIDGVGWSANLREPPMSRSTIVEAWIGPLPTLGAPAMEFDL